MPKLNIIIRSLLLFLVFYFVLTLSHKFEPVRNAHNHAYALLGEVVYNVFNPHFYVDLKTADRNINKEIDITYELFIKNNNGFKLLSPSFRKEFGHDIELSHSIDLFIHIPMALLLALILATPIPWRRKLFSIVLATVLYYIYITLYISYRFELLLARQPLDTTDWDPTSVWGHIVKFIGGYGTNEQNMLMAVICWGIVCFSPALWKVIQKPGQKSS